jgi:hypothetical protein
MQPDPTNAEAAPSKETPPHVEPANSPRTSTDDSVSPSLTPRVAVLAGTLLQLADVAFMAGWFLGLYDAQAALNWPEPTPLKFFFWVNTVVAVPSFVAALFGLGVGTFRKAAPGERRGFLILLSLFLLLLTGGEVLVLLLIGLLGAMLNLL